VFKVKLPKKSRGRRRIPGREEPKLLVDFARQKRLAQGLSQERFGALMGVTRGCVKEWETHGKLPSWENRKRLVDFVGFDPETDAVGDTATES
jgi:DNA-binding transcriptional regulator YiaG